MISLADNRTALMNLGTTIKAIDDLDVLIEYYSANKPGPAYCTFEHVDGPGTVRVQFSRGTISDALMNQRDELVAYLETLGIEA